MPDPMMDPATDQQNAPAAPQAALRNHRLHQTWKPHPNP